ncbi:multidrug efflux MFS transporter [Candidatus Obscuribacterales bacterium]|nr:multidrug efflux MFS transporter [Candidatus Obscuribacterales bacterium]
MSQSSKNKSTKLVEAKASKVEEVKIPFKSWVAVLGAALGAFMAVLDIQIVNSSLQDIQGAIGATLDEGTWVATSYLVAEIITIPLTAYLSRVFTTRWYVVVNAFLFVIFSMCCAFAWDLNSMIVFRALQGFTGGTLIPMSLTIILTSLPPAKRTIGMAIFAVTATFAPSIGPAIGGWLTDTFNWRYIFYLNLIPGMVLIGLMLYALPKEKLDLKLLKQGDWLGMFTMALGLGCLEVVLEEGNRKDWFGSPMIVNLAIIAAVSLAILIWHELRTKYPLLHLRLLANRNFGLGSVANVALGVGLYGSIYLMPTYLAQIQAYSPLQIGEVLVWLGLPQLLIIPFVPKLMQRFDSRILLGLGLTIFALSSFLSSSMTHDTAGPQFLVSNLVRAMGQPLIMVPLSTLTTGDIKPEEAAPASSLFNMMRNLGGSIGVAMVSTFVTQREQLHSSRIGEAIHMTSPVVQERLNQYTQMFITRGADSVLAAQEATKMLDRIVRRESYIQAYNDAFLLLSFVVIASVIAVIFLKKTSGAGNAAAH